MSVSTSVTDVRPEEAPETPDRPSAGDGPARPPSAEPRTVTHRWRRVVLAVGAVVALGAAAVYLVPMTRTALNTVSTDDAYVNGHLTFVAPRVAGQVARVLVDDNMRVERGRLLVQLDKEPYQVQVNLSRARLEAARASLGQAEAKVIALEGTARSRRWKLQSAIEQVNNMVAGLQAYVAALESRQATLERARSDYQRAEKLIARGAISREELDQRREAIRVAEAQVSEARAQVQEIRVGLGLPVRPPDGKPLTDIPENLSETFSAVRGALADLVETVAQLGVPLAASEATPKQVLAEFARRDPRGDINAVLKGLVKRAPDYRQAEAAVLTAQRDLDQAELNLRYCDIVSEIDGVVTRRNVNPGNNVLVGQSLMAVRSVQDVWIDANFKETQLDYLAIGQRAEIYADMYGKRRVFRGRVSGFTMGTGSTLAILPAQNATGNFVKVVQRLPVRIDLVDGNPEDTPLFVGLSVTPYVDFKGRPTGPDAGRRLQSPAAGATGPGR